MTQTELHLQYLQLGGGGGEQELGSQRGNLIAGFRRWPRVSSVAAWAGAAESTLDLAGAVEKWMLFQPFCLVLLCPEPTVLPRGHGTLEFVSPAVLGWSTVGSCQSGDLLEEKLGWW